MDNHEVPAAGAIDLSKRGFPVKETRLIEAATLDAREGGLTLAECHGHVALVDIVGMTRYLVPVNHNLVLSLARQLTELMRPEDRAALASLLAEKGA